MKSINYHIYLSDLEYHHIINSLVGLKNSLIVQGKYTDAVDDVLCKFLKARKTYGRGQLSEVADFTE